MLRRLLKGLKEVVYPKICLGCATRLKDSPAEHFVCDTCWGTIKKNAPPFCRFCGRHLDRAQGRNICPGCIRQPLYFDRAFSPCAYDGVIKELIHQFKYKNKDYLGKSLSRLMIEFIREYNLGMDYLDFIVPMPLHAARLREREFNQAEVLSRHIAPEFDKEINPDCLLRRALRKPQAELKNDQRFTNIAGSFAVNPKTQVRGKNILLVDDVLTTGATASEAASTLKKAGANIIFVLTLAN